MKVWNESNSPEALAALRAHIESRCEEIGECLIFDSKQIRAWTPTGARSMHVKRAYWLACGNALPDDLDVMCTCGESRCVAHLKLMTRAARVAKFWKGRKQTAASVQKRRAAMADRYFPDSKILAILDDQGSTEAVAARHGVSRSVVSRVRRGERLLSSNQWSGLMRRAA